LEAPREEKTPAPRKEEKPAQRDLAAERPARSDDFDVAFEEAGAPAQKSAGKKKKGGDEDFLFLGKGI
jgi:hypothetical protein